MDTKTDANPGSRRRHGPELKRQVLAECAAPGASVAKVAMSHGLNANLVHKWRRQAQAGGGVVAAAFIPVAVAAPTVMSEPAPFVDLELQRGATSVRVRWPMAGASSCAACRHGHRQCAHEAAGLIEHWRNVGTLDSVKAILISNDQKEE